MDVRLRQVLRLQDSVVATWQLRRHGVSEERIATLAREWRWMHDGVWLAAFNEPTQRQLWWAATLTTPATVLSHASAAACWGIWPQRSSSGGFETVTRKGTKGPLRTGDLLVHHSQTLKGNVTRRHGFLITTAERATIDLWPHLTEWEQRKLLREAFRTRRITAASMTKTLKAHRGRRGTATLKALVSRYERLNLDRCKSDAEALALEILDNHHRPLPQVNEHQAGLEADLSWPDLRVIIEIDGPQFHRDKLYDAYKTRTWQLAGWTVRRIDSDDIFERPERLLALAPE